jgi:uncharacterized protein
MWRKHECLASVLLLILFAVTGIRGSAQGTATTKPVGDLSVSELTNRAEAGDPVAQNELGVRYGLGFDVPKDPGRAIDWFHKAARQGYGRASFNLAVLYFNSDDIKENKTLALQWFLLSEEAGDANGKDGLARMQSQMSAKEMNAAYVAVGDRYVDGTDVKQDYGRAMQWYQKAADGRDGAACEKIAALYARGLGVAKDNVQIIYWLQRGADLGDPVASYDLGRVYEKGTAVPRDGEKAAKLYENAAAYNNPKAMLALGNLYLDGKVVPQNQEKALMWFLLGERYGDCEAGKQGAVLSVQLPRKQVEKAKQDVARYAGQKKPPALVQK